MSNGKSKLSIVEIKENYAEIKPPYSEDEAILEASRCLYCYDAPCIRACPTKIDVPMFIQQIRNRDTTGAAKTIFMQNILGGSCARVCPTQELCEGACVYNNLNDKPIDIGRLQRFATDHAMEEDLDLWDCAPDTGKSVGIVGAGPAGLSCAYALTKMGHKCTVYEAKERPGGLNTYGVAGYKIDTDFALKEVEYVQRVGIELLLNTPIGESTPLSSLLEKHDAVFLGIGLGNTRSLGIEGEDVEGCVDALEFIEPTRDPAYENLIAGEHVLVLGAGNTAIDAAAAAVRIGAERVSIVYRRGEKEMSAYDFEYEHAKSDGVQFIWNTAPQRVVVEDGRITGLACVKTKSTEGGSPAPIEGSEHVIPCDLVVKALGQTPFDWLKDVPDLKLVNGTIEVDPESRATSIPGLFAGGDSIGASEVVYAVQEGKEAARGIASYLEQA